MALTVVLTIKQISDLCLVKSVNISRFHPFTQNKSQDLSGSGEYSRNVGYEARIPVWVNPIQFSIAYPATSMFLAGWKKPAQPAGNPCG